MLKTDSSLTVHFISTCQNLPDIWSYNVRGEIYGALKPREFITVGGHLDTWDIAEGAHDDGGGSDITPLKALGALQIVYVPDSQRYFWYHHSANDTFEQVNIRQLQMGSAAIASLIFLIDFPDL